MRNTLIALVLLWPLGLPLAQAGNFFSGSGLAFVSRATGGWIPESDRVSVSLRKEADFVSMPVLIKSDHRNSSDRFKAISQAKAAIQQAADKNKDVHIYNGPVVLRNRKVDFWGYGNFSQMRLHVLVPLAGTKKDIFQCATEIKQFVDSVSLPKKVKIESDEILLAVDNPAQYREQLLKLIGEEVSQSRAALGADGKAVVKGLESPVRILQADERHVELFLDYSVSITLSE